MTVESRCRALLKGGHRNSNGGNQCLKNTGDESVFCAWHQKLFEALLSQEMPEIEKTAILCMGAVMDYALSRGMKECS